MPDNEFFESLKTKEKLSDDDFAKIEASVLAEEGLDAQGEPLKKDDEKEKKEIESKEPDEVSSDEKKAEEEKKAALADRAKAVGLGDDATEEEIIEREKGADPGDKGSKKDTPDPASGDHALSDEDRVKSLVSDQKVSEEKAREIVDGENRILEKYGATPDAWKLARAYREQQVDLTFARDRIKDLENAQSRQIPGVDITKVDGVKAAVEQGLVKTPDGKVVSRDFMVSAYRKENPDVTEDLDDDRVFALASRELMVSLQEAERRKVEGMKREAESKRTELLSSLGKDDEELKSELEKVLSGISDAAITSESFNFQNYVWWAKGKNAESRERAAYQRGLTKGKESAEIARVNDTPVDKKGPKAKSAPALTDAQKKRALEMFDGLEATDEEKFSWYMEDMKKTDDL